jgi:branched-chain amino acid transport system substrate-binding protein
MKVQSVRRTMPRRSGAHTWQAVACAAVTAGLVLAGCSSGSQSSSSSTSSPAGAGKSTVSGSAINVGSIDSASGPYGDPEWLNIANVWAQWTNSHGGVNGHPVHMFAVDDAGSATQGLTDAKQLIQQDHVVAIIGANSSADTSWLAYAAQQHVPVIGGDSLTGQAPNPDFYPTAEGLTALVPSAFKVAKELGLTKYGQLFALGAPIAQIKAGMTQAAKPFGVQLVYSTVVSPTQADFTAPCLGLKSAGANMANISISPTITPNIIESCQRQGYNGAFMTVSGVANPNWNQQQSIKAARLYVLDFSWPFYDHSTPAQQAYFQAINTYSSGMLSNPGYNAGVQDAWVGMEMFGKAAQLGDLGPSSTAADVLNGLSKVHNETLGGLSIPLSYGSSGSGQGFSCFFVSELKGGSWVDPMGSAAQCVGS